MGDEDKSSEASGPEETPAQDEVPEQELDDLTLLRAKLDEALREKDQFRTMAQRGQADLTNYRRRAAEEKDERARTAKSDLLLKVLSVIDDLDRALALIPDDAVAPGWLDGLNLVLRSMNSILDSEGVIKIEAVGQRFEPWEFEAVQYEETHDAEEGQVIKVVRDGYKHHDRVLRAAQVIVANKPEIQEQPETSGEETQ